MPRHLRIAHFHVELPTIVLNEKCAECDRQNDNKRSADRSAIFTLRFIASPHGSKLTGLEPHAK